ncbi:hypothetical protein Tco_0105914 [Tanacetum coccineum]
MQTKIELTLEQPQQGVSDEVLEADVTFKCMGIWLCEGCFKTHSLGSKCRHGKGFDFVSPPNCGDGVVRFVLYDLTKPHVPSSLEQFDHVDDLVQVSLLVLPLCLLKTFCPRSNLECKSATKHQCQEEIIVNAIRSWILTCSSLQLMRETLAESSPPLFDVDEEDLDLGEWNIKKYKRKICDGHYTTAVRVLSSSGVAPYNDVTLEELKTKHPFKTAPSLPHIPIDHHHLVASPSVVLNRIKNFPRGTSCGRDGLRAQHLMDCLSEVTVAIFDKYYLEAFGFQGSAVMIGHSLDGYLDDLQFGVVVSGGGEAILHVVNRLIEGRGDDVGLSMLLAWYLDDGTIIRDTLVVGKVLELIMEYGPSCGLHLNVDKTESTSLQTKLLRYSGIVAYVPAFDDAFRAQLPPKSFQGIFMETMLYLVPVKYEAKCANIGYGFLPFSFSSFGKLKKDAVTRLKRIRKFSVTQDIRARAAVYIFNKISFVMAKGVGAQLIITKLSLMTSLAVFEAVEVTFKRMGLWLCGVCFKTHTLRSKCRHGEGSDFVSPPDCGDGEDDLEVFSTDALGLDWISTHNFLTCLQQLSSYTSGHLEVSESAACLEKLHFPALLVMLKFSRICFSFVILEVPLSEYFGFDMNYALDFLCTRVDIVWKLLVHQSGGSPAGIHGLFSGWYCGLASRKVTLGVSMAWAKGVTTGTLVRYETSCGRNHLEDVEVRKSGYSLIPLSRGSFDVIEGMDWLSKRKFVIVCHEKVVRIPLEGDEILRVHGKRTQGVLKTLMNTKSKEEHEVHLKLVLESLRKEKLYAKFSKLGDALSRKERVKSRRVKGMILAAQSEVFKQENVLAERLHGLDQQMERKGDESCKEWNSGDDQLRLRWMIYLVMLADAVESVRDAIGFGYCLASSSGWTKDWESSLTGLELVQESTDKVVLVKERPKAARDRQKSYVDYGRKPLELRWEIRLRLPVELNSVHDTFHVSNLKKCLADANLHVPLNKIKINKTLHFVEELVEITDREVKSLKRSRILLVKVRWNLKRGPEFTWEREDYMKSKYPQLFVDRAVEPTS